MLTSVFLMHSAAEFLFAFLYAHMGKFKSGCLHLTFFFSNKRPCTAFSRSVKGRMPPLPMPRDYLAAFKFPSEPDNVCFIFRG